MLSTVYTAWQLVGNSYIQNSFNFVTLILKYAAEGLLKLG